MKIENVILVLAIVISFVVLGVTLLNMNKIEEEIGVVDEIENNQEIATDVLSKDEMVKELLDVYLKEYEYFEDNNVGTFPEILEKLNLETEENIEKLLANNSKERGNFKTNVKYEDFKAAMLTMVSEKYFEKNYSNYTNIDGFVSVNNGAGGYIPLELEEIKFVKYDEEIDCHIYNAKVKDMELYSHYEADDTEISLEECFLNYVVNIKETEDGVVIDEITFIPKAEDTEKKENIEANNNDKTENKTEEVKSENETQTENVSQPELNNTSNDENNTEIEKEYIQGQEVAGYIKLPKFNVEGPIFTRVAQATMNLTGAGISMGSLNEVGHTVLMGHAYAGYPFEKISELENGDTVIITDAQKREITYEVFDKQIVNSNDATYMIRDTAGKREITMQTGHSDTTRLIVLIREKN